MIVVGEYRGLGPAAVGTNRGLADPAAMGSCCCNPGPYKSAWFFIATNLPGRPVTYGTIRLYTTLDNSTNLDIERSLDVTPVQDKTIAQLYNTDFYVNIIENGEIAGRLEYEFISAVETITNIQMTCNVTIHYGGHVYRAENCIARTTYKNPPDGSITMDRAPIIE